jgi:hypothetical protein
VIYGTVTFFIILIFLLFIGLAIGINYASSKIDKLKEQIDFFTKKSNDTRSPDRWEQQGKWLITQNENKFKKHLRKHLPQSLEIHCNVRLIDVLAKEHATYLFSQPKRYGDIIMMHIDYTIVESESTKIVMVIELDDSSHDSDNHIKRDKKKNDTLQRSAIYCTRIKSKDAYDPHMMKNIIEFCKEKTLSR